MDVSFLQPVYDATGPFATVCADVTHTTENADTELELRVRGITHRLAQPGAPAAASAGSASGSQSRAPRRRSSRRCAPGCWRATTAGRRAPSAAAHSWSPLTAG